MVKTRTVEMQTQLVGYEFKKKGLPTDKNIAVENSKVSNDYFWKTNEYTDKDVFGRTLDLTALINKPDGYLKGSLSDTQDVDYYKFNITEYRALSFAKDMSKMTFRQIKIISTEKWELSSRFPVKKYWFIFQKKTKR